MDLEHAALVLYFGLKRNGWSKEAARKAAIVMVRQMPRRWARSS